MQKKTCFAEELEDDDEDFGDSQTESPQSTISRKKIATPTAGLPTPIANSRRKSALKNFGYRDDGDAANILKKRFHILDVSGNGMLEKDELGQLLPGMNAEDLEALFSQIDIDGNESVSFNEFIDFVFKPVENEILKTKLQTGHEDFAEFKSLRCMPRESSDAHSRHVAQLQFTGSMMFNAVNGMMDTLCEKPYNGFPAWEWSRSRRVKNVVPMERSDPKIRKKKEAEDMKPMFSLGVAGANLNIFYSWTSDYSQVGWFIAEFKPLERQPVSEYILFNPSPLADRPDECRAMWQTKEGDRDKRLICEDAITSDLAEPDTTVAEEHLEDEELWGELSDDSEGETADWKEGDWEREWGEQPGEGDEEEDDGWDSDTFLEQNEHRRKIGDEARRKKEEADALKKANEIEAVQEPAPAQPVEQPAPAQVEEPAALQDEEGEETADATQRPVRVVRNDRGRGRRAGVDYARGSMMQAPGFQVVTVVQEDHLSHRHAGKKTTRESLKRAGSLKRLSPKGRKSSVVSSASSSSVVDPSDYSLYEDGRFIDEDFGPCLNSLGAPMDEVDGWTRLSELTADPCLFRKIVPESCLHQAFPGNVWFLNAIAAAAEYPAWIQSMFGQRTMLSKTGRYKVRLYHPGLQRFVRIVVDDYVPTKRGSPVFAGVTSDGEIWVALVEKAFAKFCGSYAHTQWGLSAYGFHYICGGAGTGSWARLGPSRWRRSFTVWNGGDEGDTLDRVQGEGKQEVGDWRDDDEVWAMLRMGMERCFPVACGLDKAKKSEVGLLTDRMYSIIAAREVPTDEGWTLRMVLLRNPYDAGEWKGRWSDGSDTWKTNPEVTKYLQFTPHYAQFWMSYSDFAHFFDLVEFVRKAMPIQGASTHKLRGYKRGLLRNNQRGFLIDENS